MGRAESSDINVQAMEQMNMLNGRFTEAGYTDKEREILLVRLLLLYFSQDTGVFSRVSFYECLTAPLPGDPDAASRLQMLFSALAGEHREDFPELFRRLPVLSRSLFMQEIPARAEDPFLLPAIMAGKDLPWGELSPALFGALFQEIMNQTDRREWGAYYTSEDNIDRLIDPLVFDELLREREACRGNRRRLTVFYDKLSRITFLDPACGCGNFLIRIYQRLRLLELDVIEELFDTSQRILDISLYCHVSVAQFLGIELSEFQANIARVGLWLAERQMDLLAAERFGTGGVTPTMISLLGIRVANALTLNWSDLVSKDRLSYIVGNPPFVGARLMNASQKADMKAVFGGFQGWGELDYVTAWYRKAAAFMMGTDIRAAFVSTNSISQGEQASLLWKTLRDTWHMQIDFARRTFIWNNECREQARVHCVIIGFSDADHAARGSQHQSLKPLFEGTERRLVPYINAYLAAAPEVVISARRDPVSEVPAMQFGSMANDGGHLILSAEEREKLLDAHPSLRPWIRLFLGAVEFIRGKNRYCLWFTQETPEEIYRIPEIAERLSAVQQYRAASSRPRTKEMALFPQYFCEDRQPQGGSMILVPRVSSVRRQIIPMGFADSRVVASDAMQMIPQAEPWLFALLNARMHMLWVQTVAGRLKSDYRYSASIVYNNYPFPELDTAAKKELSAAAEQILTVRQDYLGRSLAWLYDPETMPEPLRAAHQQTDALVEEIYGCTGQSEERQLALLFERAGAQ